MFSRFSTVLLTLFVVIVSADSLLAQRGGGRRSGGGRRGGRRASSSPPVERHPLQVRESQGHRSRIGPAVSKSFGPPAAPSGMLGTVMRLPAAEGIATPSARHRPKPPTALSLPTTGQGDTIGVAKRRRRSRTPSKSKLRLWVDASGKHSIRGELAAFKDGTVWIKRADGLISRVPLDQLSSVEQLYVTDSSR